MTSRRVLKPAPVIPVAQIGGDYKVVRLQRNIEQATRTSREHQQAKGKNITVKMPAHAAGVLSTVKAAHGLGRKPQGYNETKRFTTQVPKYKFVSSDSRFITFASSLSASLEFWVY